MNIKDGVNMGKISNKTKMAANIIEDIIQTSFNAIANFKMYDNELKSLYYKCENMDNSDLFIELSSIKMFQKRCYTYAADFINKNMNEAIKDKGLNEHKNTFKRKLFTQKRLEDIFNLNGYAENIIEDISNSVKQLNEECEDALYEKKVKILSYRKGNVDSITNLASALIKITDYFEIFTEV